MVNDGFPDEAAPAGRRPARSPRSTPELIAELQARAAGLTLAAIAVVNNDVTQFVFAVDDDPLGALNSLIGTGGHPIGLVGVRIGGGAIEYYAQPFVEYRHNPHALAYLQSLRHPFLALMQTHVDRIPDDPRLN